MNAPVRIKKCKTCRQWYPRQEPDFSQYNKANPNAGGTWKQVCNHCIAAAAEKRSRHLVSTPAGPDPRDSRHPLEAVFAEWRSVNAA